MSRAPFLPVAHIGPHLSDKNPALWLVPYVYLKNDPAPHLLLRDPFPSRKDKDNASFIHFPARALFNDEVAEEDGKKVILFDKATRNILLYYAGMTFADRRAELWGTCMHHEPTCLFSGPQKNQQVAVFTLCVGSHLDTLPEIKTLDEGGAYPSALEGNQEALDFCNEYRKHVAWVSAKHIMQNIVQRGPRNNAIYAPNASPFRIANLTLSRDLPPREMIVQGTVLYVFQKTIGLLPDRYGPNSKPEGRKEWISKGHIARALYELDGGKYRKDSRIPQRKIKSLSP